MATEPKRRTVDRFTPAERFFVFVAPALAAALTANYHWQRNVEERLADTNRRVATVEIQVWQNAERTKAMRDAKTSHETELEQNRESRVRRDPFQNASGVLSVPEPSVPEPEERRPYGPVDVPNEFRPVPPHFDFREQPGALDR
ncbi:MAG TPA: hypothetical protein VFE76_14350 [Myxococcales bacterium]|jgi:hypothetical protein|nr:hypothetical protein [Myxococcales bacterium]